MRIITLCMTETFAKRMLTLSNTMIERYTEWPTGSRQWRTNRCSIQASTRIHTTADIFSGNRDAGLRRTLDAEHMRA